MVFVMDFAEWQGPWGLNQVVLISLTDDSTRSYVLERELGKKTMQATCVKEMGNCC